MLSVHNEADVNYTVVYFEAIQRETIILMFKNGFIIGSERKRKRRSRWGTEEKRTFIPGMPTTMPPNLSPEQQQAYIGMTEKLSIKRCMLASVKNKDLKQCFFQSTGTWMTYS